MAVIKARFQPVSTTPLLIYMDSHDFAKILTESPSNNNYSKMILKIKKRLYLVYLYNQFADFAHIDLDLNEDLKFLLSFYYLIIRCLCYHSN